MKRLPTQISLVLLMPWATAGYAGIIYVDIADVPVFQGSYDLDFDDDDVVDFTFEASGGGQFSLQVQGSNRTAENVPTDLAPLAPGFLIGPDLSSTDRHWSDPGAQVGITACMTLPPPFGFYCTGEFAGQTAFMGAQFQISGETHYGWVRIDCTFPLGGTILDYAYESNPDQAIIAGAIPEPSTLMLMLAAAGVLALRSIPSRT